MTHKDNHTTSYQAQEQILIHKQPVYIPFHASVCLSHSFSITHDNAGTL